MRNAYKILAGKPERKRRLRRSRHKWEDIIKIGFKETGCGMWIAFMWLRIRASGGLL
jgi:hypothetical protein